MSNPPLPNPNRYITTHTPTGTSTFTSSPSLPISLPVHHSLGGSLQRLAYSTLRPPISLNSSHDLSQHEASLQRSLAGEFQLVPPQGGSKIWYNDIPPGGGSTMHRSVSFDVVVLVAGEVELTLEDGKTCRVKAGDLVVQRGTMHKWLNPSEDEWARMVVVVTECEGIVTEAGEKLGEEFP